MNALTQRIFLAAALLSGLFLSAHAASCGTWWWKKSEHRWGLVNIVGDANKEAAAISELQRWGLDRVYGSYGSRPINEPAVIRNWNNQLDAAGISSQILLSENTWIFPEYRTNLLELIQLRLINFNAAAAAPAERFDALHLDIEPQGLSEWNAAGPAERNGYLLLLRDTFHDVRTYLDSHTAEHIPVYADLPVWFDNISDSTGWTNETARNAWFADLNRDLDGLSLMAYERSSLSSISSGISWEISTMTNEIRAGLEIDIGPDATWETFEELTNMLAQIQTAFTPEIGTDLHTLYAFEDYTPPLTSSLSIIASAPDSLTISAANLSPGKTNRIETCRNLQTNSWQTAATFISWTPTSNITQSVTAPTNTLFLHLNTLSR